MVPMRPCRIRSSGSDCSPYGGDELSRQYSIGVCCMTGCRQNPCPCEHCIQWNKDLAEIRKEKAMNDTATTEGNGSEPGVITAGTNG